MFLSDDSRRLAEMVISIDRLLNVSTVNHHHVVKRSGGVAASEVLSDKAPRRPTSFEFFPEARPASFEVFMDLVSDMSIDFRPASFELVECHERELSIAYGFNIQLDRLCRRLQLLDGGSRRSWSDAPRCFSHLFL